MRCAAVQWHCTVQKVLAMVNSSRGEHVPACAVCGTARPLGAVLVHPAGPLLAPAMEPLCLLHGDTCSDHRQVDRSVPSGCGSGVSSHE